MAEKPRLSPQNIGGSARAVPTVTQGEVTTNFRNVPTVRPTGFEAQARAFGVEGQAAEAITQNLNGMVKNIIADTEADIKEQQKLKERELNARIELARKFPKTLVVGQVAASDLNARAALTRITQETNDPAEAATLFQAHLEGATSNMDGEASNAVQSVQMMKAAPVFEDMQKDLEDGASQAAEGTTDDGIIASGSRVVELAAPKSDAENLALNAEVRTFDALVDSATHLTPSERLLIKKDFASAAETSALTAEIAVSDNPLSAALKVLQNPGISFDAKQRVLSIASQVNSMQSQMQAEARAAQTRARERQEANLMKQTYGEVTAENFAEKQSIAARILDRAQTPAEVNRATKLIESIEERNEERYIKSDPDMLTMYAVGVSEGNIGGDIGQQVVNDARGNGLSNQDADRLIADMERSDNEIFKTQEWELLQNEAAALWPDGTSKVDAGQMLLAMAEGRDPAELLGNDLSKQQTAQYNAFLQDMRNKVVNGEVATGTELLAAGRETLQRFRSIKAQTPAAVTDVRQLSTTHMAPQQKAAYSKALKDPIAVTLANQNYLVPEGIAKLQADKAAGKISELDAKKVMALIMTVPRVGTK